MALRRAMVAFCASICDSITICALAVQWSPKSIGLREREVIGICIDPLVVFKANIYGAWKVADGRLSFACSPNATI